MRAQRLHQPPLEIEEAQQTAGVLHDGKLAAKEMAVAWEAIRRGLFPLRCRLALALDWGVGNGG